MESTKSTCATGSLEADILAKINYLSFFKLQISRSNKKTEEKINSYFSNLKRTIIDSIEEQNKRLIEKVNETNAKNVELLEKIEEDLNRETILVTPDSKVDSKLIDQSHENFLLNLSNVSCTYFKDVESEIRNSPIQAPDTSMLISSPENQHPLSFYHNNIALKEELINQISSHCTNLLHHTTPICIISPVKVLSSSVHLSWKILSESEESTHKYEYHVQYTQVDDNNPSKKENEKNGDKPLDTQKESHIYVDAYRGCNPYSIVKNLKPDSSYLFRVAARVDDKNDDDDLLLWSLPICVSTLKTFHCWRETSNDKVKVAGNKLRIVDDITNSESLFISTLNSFPCPGRINFSIENAPGGQDVEGGWGISDHYIHSVDQVKEKGCLYVTRQGVIYIDGLRKITQLPVVKTGDVVVFECVEVKGGKARVTIEIEDKVATFDWSSPFKAEILKQNDSENNTKNNIVNRNGFYFFCNLSLSGWDISVE